MKNLERSGRLLALLLLLLLGASCGSAEDGGFAGYGVYQVAEQVGGEKNVNDGVGGIGSYYVLKQGYAYLFDKSSSAPPDVPVTTWTTEYYPAAIAPGELAENGLSDQGETKAFRKYTLLENGFGETVYERDGALWIRLRIGLAEGGVCRTYRLEKLPEEALKETFGVAYDGLGQDK